MKKIRNSIAAICIIAAIALPVSWNVTGCATRKVVTPASTNSAGVVTAPVTNVVVNQAVVALEAAGLQLAFTAGVPYVVKEVPSAAPILRDFNAVLQGMLNGATTNSVSQLLTATGQNNPAMAAQIAPLVAQVSAWEQAELKKYGATTYGQIVIPEATAISEGIQAGLLAPLPK